MEKPRKLVIVSWALTALTSITGGGVGTFAVIQPLFQTTKNMSPPPPYSLKRPPPPLPAPPPQDGRTFESPILFSNDNGISIPLTDEFFITNANYPKPDVECPNIEYDSKNRKQIFIKNVQSFDAVIITCTKFPSSSAKLYGLHIDTEFCPNNINNETNDLCCKRTNDDFGYLDRSCPNGMSHSNNYLLKSNSNIVILIDHAEQSSTDTWEIYVMQTKYNSFPSPPPPPVCPPLDTNTEILKTGFYPHVLNITNPVSNSKCNTSQSSQNDAFALSDTVSSFEACFQTCFRYQPCKGVTINEHTCYVWYTLDDDGNEVERENCFRKNFIGTSCKDVRFNISNTTNF